MRSRWAALMLAVIMAVLLVSCSSSAPITPTPDITSIAPDSIVAGSANFTVSITGDNFVSTPQQTVALWNGSPRKTVLNSITGQLAVTILASDVTSPGVGLLSVMNPPPGGVSAFSTSFGITPLTKGAATITSLSPASAKPGTKGPLLLTVNGTGFIPGSSVITWNGTFRQPVTATATALATNLTTTDLATAGVASVAVNNLLPSGIIVSSISVDFTIGSSSAADPSFPQVVSVNAYGGPSNGRSTAPAISADGRFVAFYSDARNLVGGTASGNIFVRDTCLGVANCTPKTTAVDLAPDGSGPDRDAWADLAISADGRFVAFSSYATNLVAGLTDSTLEPGIRADASRLNVFVRDTCGGANAPAGCTPHTEIISRDLNGQRAFGSFPSLSRDGRFVAFHSLARNMAVDAPAPGPNLYVRDICAGPTATVACLPTTFSVSAAETSTDGHVPEARPLISANGRYVAYQARLPGEATAARRDTAQIYMRDMCLGADAPAACVPSRVRISVAPDGSVLGGLNGEPSLSSDGRFVAFESLSMDTQSAEPAASENLYLRDTCLGPTAPDGCTPSTKLIYSQPVSNATAPESLSPAISASGRFLSFVSAGVKSGADSNAPNSLFIYDTCFGASTGCISAANLVAAPGQKSQPLILDMSTSISLSSDGRFAAFYSLAGTNASIPVSGLGDVFLTATPSR